MNIINHKSKKAFTMMELIFVIVIMGILAKFGVEFLTTAYSGFINSKINNKLQQNSASALEFVAARLQYRIKASTIAREPAGDDSFTPISLYFGQTANILEWIGYDIEGYRGGVSGTWSGVLDLNNTETNGNQLSSIDTNTTNINNIISALSNGNSGMSSGVNSSAAIYFVNPDALEINASYWGWDMNPAVSMPLFNTQSDVYIHPVKAAADTSLFIPINANGVVNTFTGVDAYEFYQLAWSAYAVGIDNYDEYDAATNPDGTNTGDLTLWYNYQPWRGEDRNDGNSSVIMQNVSSFQFIARESIIKIQVCVKSILLIDEGEEYSICKEKTIF